MGLPGVRHADGTEIAPHLKMRVDLDLFAGVRPVRRLPGTPAVLADPRAADVDLSSSAN
jgi:3-isopropylmalate dehydrogenase